MDGESTPRGCPIWSRRRRSWPVEGDQGGGGVRSPVAAMVAGPVVKYASVSTDGLPVPENFKVCKCKMYKCASRKCSCSAGYLLGSDHVRGGKKMGGAAMKLLGMAVLAMLLPIASAGRTWPLAPVRAANKNDEQASVSGFVLGCTPKILARDLIIYCREPPNAPMPIEACCGAAVGTVGRPSCFCLVQKEPAFGLSPLLNITNMENMLARCGASVELTQTLYNSCDGSHTVKQASESAPPSQTEKQASECPAPEPSSHNSYKVLSYIECAIIVVLMGATGYLIFWRPVPTTKIVYVPQIQLVTLSPEKEDVRLPDARDELNDDDSSVSEKEDEELSDGTDQISDTNTEDVLIDEKRVPVPNRKFIGGQWVNHASRGRRR